METVKSRLDDWETQAEIDACLGANGVTMDQVRRWRRDGLLPDVLQKQHPYSGSVVLYPAGTCAQIAAAARLFGRKNRVEYVGQQLWWEGYAVDERYWRPQLLKSAGLYDKGLRSILSFAARDEDSLEKPTLQERLARSKITNTIMSRIRGRLSREGLSAHIGVVLSVATGDFHQSDWRGPTEERGFDQARTIEAMDLEASRTDTIFGRHFAFIKELPVIFRALSRAQEHCSLTELAQGPEHPIFEARNDVRNALRMAVAFY
jgi:hypothetical protein